MSPSLRGVVGKEIKPLVIRVTEVSPAGTVTLGFEGDAHDVCRTEIYHNYGEGDMNGTTQQ